MNAKEYALFTERLMVTAAVFDHPVPPMKAGAYFQALIDLELAAVEGALTEVEKVASWFPKPNEIRLQALQLGLWAGEGWKKSRLLILEGAPKQKIWSERQSEKWEDERFRDQQFRQLHGHGPGMRGSECSHCEKVALARRGSSASLPERTESDGAR